MRISKDKSSKGSIRSKRLQAAWDDGFLRQLLAGENHDAFALVKTHSQNPQYPEFCYTCRSALKG
jgi:hypothetical protein